MRTSIPCLVYPCCVRLSLMSFFSLPAFTTSRSINYYHYHHHLQAFSPRASFHMFVFVFSLIPLTVRIPIGYWDFVEDPVYVSGGQKYLDLAFEVGLLLFAQRLFDACLRAANCLICQHSLFVCYQEVCYVFLVMHLHAQLLLASFCVFCP